MAAIADVEQGTVSRWEADETDITDAHLTIYSHLCQGAALAFLRYGARAPTRPPAPRRVGRVSAGQAVTPIAGKPPPVELGDLQFTHARAGATTDLMALEIDDVPELYPLRPGWLVIYEGAPDTPGEAAQEVAGDVLRGPPGDARQMPRSTLRRWPQRPRGQWDQRRPGVAARSPSRR